MVAFVGISVAACGGAGNPSLSSLTGPSKVRALRILPTATRACPGDAIQVTYEAALADGSRVPFGQAQSSALIRSGVAAEPKPDGSWTASADPLVSTVTGFHLTAKLASDSSIRADTVVVPKYDCRRPLVIGPGVSTQADTKHAYVRLGTFASPFYDSIVVATLEQAGQPPAVYVLVPGDFHPGGLRVSAPGANGRNGRNGKRGADSNGCQDADSGEDGESGEPGQPGGRVDLIVQADAPWLERIVSVTNVGGKGGTAGQGGAGGNGVRSSTARGASGGTTCAPKSGRPGRAGLPGEDGPAGPPPMTTTIPANLLWSGSPLWNDASSRAAIQALIDYSVKRGR